MPGITTRSFPYPDPVSPKHLTNFALNSTKSTLRGASVYLHYKAKAQQRGYHFSSRQAAKKPGLATLLRLYKDFEVLGYKFHMTVQGLGC